MTQISAKVIADSTNEAGHRITTMLVTFPRIILAEFNTHRMFSRNTASSRAIPFEKMLKSIEEDPFIPIAWQKDHKGMQGTEYFDDLETFGSKDGESKKDHIKRNWLFMKDLAVQQAKELSSVGLTKQLCNRLLEPFMWTTVIVTATEWENFFALRCPRYELFYEQIPMEFRSKKDLINFVKKVEAPEFKNQYDNLTELEWLGINRGQAEIHTMALAEAMWDSYNESVPKKLKQGQWHIPFGDDINESELVRELELDYQPNEEEFYSNDVERAKIEIATVRCARTSYTVVGEDQKPLSFKRTIEIHDALISANPKHMSPFEHCAQAMREYNCRNYPNESWSGNFKGFIQYRKFIKDENITK